MGTHWAANEYNKPQILELGIPTYISPIGINLFILIS